MLADRWRVSRRHTCKPCAAESLLTCTPGGQREISAGHSPPNLPTLCAALSLASGCSPPRARCRASSATPSSAAGCRPSAPPPCHRRQPGRRRRRRTGRRRSGRPADGAEVRRRAGGRRSSARSLSPEKKWYPGGERAKSKQRAARNAPAGFSQTRKWVVCPRSLSAAPDPQCARRRRPALPLPPFAAAAGGALSPGYTTPARRRTAACRQPRAGGKPDAAGSNDEQRGAVCAERLTEERLSGSRCHRPARKLSKSSLQRESDGSGECLPAARPHVLLAVLLTATIPTLPSPAATAAASRRTRQRPPQQPLRCICLLNHLSRTLHPRDAGGRGGAKRRGRVLL